MLGTPERMVHLERERCPFCHADIEPGDAQLACNACRAWHHQECWEENLTACAACGSSSTGLVGKTRRATKRFLRGQRHDPKTEFRFQCSSCTEPMWAKRTAVGQQGTCPHCSQSMVVPPLEAETQTEDTDETAGTMIAITPVLAVLIAVFVGLIGAVAGGIGGLFQGVPGDAFAQVWPMANAWAWGGFLWSYALCMLLFCMVHADEADPKITTRGGVILSIGTLLSVAYPLGVWFEWLQPIRWTALHALAYVPWAFWLFGWYVARREAIDPPETKGNEPAPEEGQARGKDAEA